MKTNIHFLSYLAQFFLEWEKFRTKVVEKIKTRILCYVTFFSKILPFMRKCGKYCTAGQATDDSLIWRMRIACWTTKDTNTHSEYVILIAYPL
jgi:hypothetical protein